MVRATAIAPEPIARFPVKAHFLAGARFVNFETPGFGPIHIAKL
jgi:hypothetical protein